MPVVCAGISHHTAPVSLRERLALSDADRDDLFTRLNLERLERRTGLGELAVLSTCNRVEVYGASPDPSREYHQVPFELLELAVPNRGVAAEELAPHVYTHRGVAAVRHLCRVAAGLDSMVLGESEILGQVQEAHERAREERATGPVLDAAFHTAVRAGRRVRAETGIAQRPASVSSEAIRIAEEMAGPLSERSILIVGSGKMGRHGGKVFRAKGARRLMVVSRTRERAESVALQWGAEPLGWHHLAEAIRAADIVFTSTDAPHPVITAELVQSGLGERSRPLLVLDIAVPRDVEESVRDLPGVDVVDIDAIQRRLDGNLAARRQAVAHAEAILDDEIRRFEEWRRDAELRPLITAMRSRTEEIRREELRRVLRKLGPVPPDVEAHLDKFSRSLVNKLLHEPTRRLKEETDPGRYDAYAEITRELFGLPKDTRPATDP